MDSPRRSRSQLPPLQQEEQEQVKQQRQSESELPRGTRRVPYPSGDGFMIIQDGFDHA